MTTAAAGPATWDASEGAVDENRPWPGLASYAELHQQYFFGRDSEIDALYRRVRRKSLTILFGQSGLGKTSLLHAGLFPVLRKDGMLPVSIRLDYAPSAPALDVQVRVALADAIAAVGGTLPGNPGTATTLWEVFHDPERVPRDASGAPLVTVLVFDQFEEMFTRGYATDAGRARAAEFVNGLAALVERWVPSAVEARLARDPAFAERLDYDRDDVHVLISLREDYLPHLEELRAALPSLSAGGMRLTRMSAATGLEAVMGPGSLGAGEPLVTADVAKQIMRFVSRTRRSGGELQSLDDGDVEPSLLSLFCRELNARRLAAGLPRISAELLLGSSEDILADFYNRALGDQPPAVRAFVEDELVTDSGVRENMAVERAERRLARDGVPPGALDVLVSRRLLHIEERLGTRRVELTHDVLLPVIERSRIERRQREQVEEAERREAETNQLLRERTQKTRIYIGGLLAIVAVLALLLGWVAIEVRRAHENEARIRTESDQTSVFIRGLANALRYAADSNISGKAIERYFLGQSKTYLDSLLKIDPNSQRAMTTMATVDLLAANMNLSDRLGDTVHADSHRRDSLGIAARAHTRDAIKMSTLVLQGDPTPDMRAFAYDLVWWAGEDLRSAGDTEAGIGVVWSADTMAQQAQDRWDRAGLGRPPLKNSNDSTVHAAPLVRVRLDGELGDWLFARKRYALADSAYAHAMAAERRFGQWADQADSQVAVRFATMRFGVQRQRVHRMAGDSARLQTAYVDTRDSARALLRTLPTAILDTGGSHARTRADSEAINLSWVYEQLGDDFRLAGDTAAAIDLYEHDLTVDSTMASRYPVPWAFNNMAYTVDKLSETYDSVGVHLLARGDTAGSRRVFDHATALKARLALQLLQQDTTDKRSVASALGNYAWALLIDRQPADAVEAAKQALRLAPTEVFVWTNLAHGLVLTGHFDEGMAIYEKYWNTKLPEGTFGDAILKDFHDLAAAGVKDPALARAAVKLKSLHPKPATATPAKAGP
jgi:tetratricopeptide (TPR) repeat protein